MTHLANKGENRARILAGLYDAVCENVQVLIKPAVSPPRVVLVGGVSRSRRIRDRFRQFLAKNQMERHGCRRRTTTPVLRGAGLRRDRRRAARAGAAPGRAARARGRRQARALARAGRPPRVGASHRHDAAAGATGPDPSIARWSSSASTSARPAPRRSRSTPTRAPWCGRATSTPTATRSARPSALMRQLIDSPGQPASVRAFGATGSGREIVGSLMTTVYGAETVFVLNEIAAHATGALHFDPRRRHHLRDRRPGRQVRPAGRRPHRRRRDERGLQRRHRLVHRGAGQEVRGHQGRGPARPGGGGGRRRRVARPALLGVHGRDHRRGGRRRRRAARDHRRHLRLDHPELPQPGEGQPLGRPGGLLPGHAVRVGRAGRGRWLARPAARSSSRPTRAPWARSASRC